jgi:hypothetical protein
MRSRAAALSAGAIVTAAALGTATALAARFQAAAGSVVSFRDLETWSRYDETMSRTERGLGLVLAGSGDMRLAFLVRFEGRSTSGPASYAVQGFRGSRTDPNAMPSTALKLTLDADTPRRAVIDLSSRVVAFPVGPGVLATSLSASLTDAERGKLATAQAIDAHVMGVEASLSPAQIRAVGRHFAR